MNTIAPPDLLEIARGTPYPLDAFLFVQRGLDYTVRRIHGDPEEQSHPDPGVESNRHVSGRQLCEGLRDFAIHEYGLLARAVLKRYRILGCEDFGQIVYAMVDSGLMHKTDEDDIGEFTGVYDFAQAFAADLSLSSE